MSTPAIAVLTAKTVEAILAEGGTSAWRLDPGHAEARKYAVCTRNKFARWSKGPEPHRTAFLVGRIRDVVQAPNHDKGRYLIRFSEYAYVDVPDAWTAGDRNPVKYTEIESLGIDPMALDWKPMPEAGNTPVPATEPPPNPNSPLTIAEAKKRLAVTFGVSPDAVEITIRA